MFDSRPKRDVTERLATARQQFYDAMRKSELASKKSGVTENQDDVFCDIDILGLLKIRNHEPARALALSSGPALFSKASSPVQSPVRKFGSEPPARIQ